MLGDIRFLRISFSPNFYTSLRVYYIEHFMKLFWYLPRFVTVLYDCILVNMKYFEPQKCFEKMWRKILLNLYKWGLLHSEWINKCIGFIMIYVFLASVHTISTRRIVPDVYKHGTFLMKKFFRKEGGGLMNSSEFSD